MTQGRRAGGQDTIPRAHRHAGSRTSGHLHVAANHGGLGLAGDGLAAVTLLVHTGERRQHDGPEVGEAACSGNAAGGGGAGLSVSARWAAQHGCVQACPAWAPPCLAAFESWVHPHGSAPRHRPAWTSPKLCLGAHASTRCNPALTLNVPLPAGEVLLHGAQVPRKDGGLAEHGLVPGVAGGPEVLLDRHAPLLLGLLGVRRCESGVRERPAQMACGRPPHPPSPSTAASLWPWLLLHGRCWRTMGVRGLLTAADLVPRLGLAVATRTTSGR